MTGITPEHALWILAEDQAVAMDYAASAHGDAANEWAELVAALQLARDAIRREMDRGSGCDCLFCIAARNAIEKYQGGTSDE